MRIGEFAKKAGVTIKTLLHYDKIGLLKPSSKSDNGYRVYCEEDFLKLQQIATLKFIGIPLSKIKQILYQPGETLHSIIAIQKKALEEKKKHIESVITILDKVENQNNESRLLIVDKLIDIIKITNMENKIIEQYKTIDNLNLRKKFHSYNINKTDWDTWCFDKMKFKDKVRILEIGCGTGEFWVKNIKNINKQCNITLSDLSEAMLNKTEENLKELEYNITYKIIDAQNIPFQDESFDVVIARHMLYCVGDIEKALSEIKRVLVKGGFLYTTTNSQETMAELNELVEKFDPELGLNNVGLCERFHLENGEQLLKKYFSEVNIEVLQGKIVVPHAEPIVAYKASTVYGSSILVGEKRKAFTEYVESILKDKGNISITTKAGIIEARK